MDPDQTAPVGVGAVLQEQSDLGLHCLTKRLLKHFSSRQKQMTFVVIGALRFKNKFRMIEMYNDKRSTHLAKFKVSHLLLVRIQLVFSSYVLIVYHCLLKTKTKTYTTV